MLLSKNWVRHGNLGGFISGDEILLSIVAHFFNVQGKFQHLTSTVATHQKTLMALIGFFGLGVKFSIDDLNV